MKTSLWFSCAVCLFLAAGCASHPRPAKRIAARPLVASSPAAELLVISAVYGSGTQYENVTYRVNDLLHQPAVEFFARPEWLLVDPTPGWNKALVIIYEYKGHRRTFTAGEGGRVSVAAMLEQAR